MSTTWNTEDEISTFNMVAIGRAVFALPAPTLSYSFSQAAPAINTDIKISGKMKMSSPTPGKGQAGDMEFTRGNLALRDHLKNGKRVFLFQQSRKGYVYFLSEMSFFDCDYYETHDTTGESRVGIKFFLKRVNATIPYELDKTTFVTEPPLQYLKPTITERSGLVLSRVGQGAYRKSIINRWENRCAVTGFNDRRILIASHIHPWKDAKDDERLDVNNGILLSPTYDALFDSHLITFDDSGKIVLSESINTSQFEQIGISGKEQIRKLNADNCPYLRKHQDVFNYKIIEKLQE